jgi:hypothetical protein
MAFHDARRCAATIETNNPTTVDGQIKSVELSGGHATVVAQGPVGAPVPLEVQKVRGASKITGPLRNFKG